MNFFAVFSILVSLFLLDPVEVSLLGGDHLENVNSVLALLDLGELALIWEDVEAVNWVLGVSITPLELFHS